MLKCFDFQVTCGSNNSIIVIGIYKSPAATARSINYLLTQNTKIILLKGFNNDGLNNASDYIKGVSSRLNLAQFISEPSRSNQRAEMAQI